MFLRNKKQKFSIRKLSAGAASVLVAVSVLGGAAVKADFEVADRADTAELTGLSLEKMFNDRHIGNKPDEEILAGLRKVLKKAKPETLKYLLNGLDNGHLTYNQGVFKRLSDRINSF